MPLSRWNRSAGPEFAGVHPYVPAAQTAGYLELIGDLEDLAGRDHRLRPSFVCSPTPDRRASSQACWPSMPITGLAVSTDRDVCLIPQSAHGTNAASAVLAGMRVVVVQHGAQRQYRHRRPAGETGRSRGQRRSDHAHLPVHPRRVRERCANSVRSRPSRRRAGLRRRREPECPCRTGQTGRVRRRRVASEPAQDVLHPARRGRPRRRTGRRSVAPCAVPSRRPAERRRACSRFGGQPRIGRHPADHMGLSGPDGPGRADGGV